MPNNINETFEVIVGNVGTVYSGSDEIDAMLEYREYITISKGKFGRASGESVTLFAGGEIEAEYIPGELEGEPAEPVEPNRIISLPALPKYLCGSEDQIQIWSMYNDTGPQGAQYTSYSNYTNLSTLQDAECEEIEDLYVLPGLLAFGDYGNTGFVGKSNYKAFCEEFGDSFGDLNIHEVTGSYGGSGIAIPVTVLIQTGCNLCYEDDPCDLCSIVESIVETLDSLESYCCIDDELMTEMETEDWEEQWDSWGKADFTKALTQRFPEYELDCLSLEGEEAVDTLFWQLCEDTGTYPSPDGNSMYIDFNDVCHEVSRVDVSSIPGVEFVLVDGIDNGELQDLADTLSDEQDAYFAGYRYVCVRQFRNYNPNHSNPDYNPNALDRIVYKKTVNSGSEFEIRKSLGWDSYTYRIEFPLSDNETPFLPGFTLTETPENETHARKDHSDPSPLCGFTNPNVGQQGSQPEGKHSRSDVSCRSCRKILKERR